tara:strand:- start:1331 stop:2494 length:1164 start_codon:yes stop_codon:yes gene_type:complete
MSAQLDKQRAKGRKNRTSIEGQHLGPMPVFDKLPLAGCDSYWAQWGKAANWFNYMCKPKDYKAYTVSYAKDVLDVSKDDLKHIKKVSDSGFLAISKLVAVHFSGFNYRKPERKMLDIHVKDLIEQGKLITEEVVEEASEPKVVISIQDRMRTKMMETLYAEFDDTVIEPWLDGDFSSKFDAFTAIKRHEIKGPGVKMFADQIQPLFTELNDAYNKTCEQAVEGYSLWTRPELKKAIKQLELVLSDIEKTQMANKVVRKTRATKPKASDKQVAKLNYLKDDNTNKLASISPIQIPGAQVLYVYNVKQKKLTEFVTDNSAGFMVQGSTIKNFDTTLSRSCGLRKPDDILPQILKKTQKQIDNVFKGLTTKVSVPAGRINKDCILLRVMN